MNYLIALLAFSAVMIVLSTLATVLVESVHKLLRTRSRDFDEMLTQLYEKSVRPQLDNIGVTLSTEAKEFVRQVRKNPAIGSRRDSFFNKFFVKTDFEELTTRQFVEQFAQTEAGQNLLKKAKTKEERVVADTISKLSYEFERYGQAASEYFHRRAAFLSLIVAFVLAITLNVDAIKLYESLAKDTSLAERVVENFDVEKLENIKKTALDNLTDDSGIKSVKDDYNEALANYLQVSGELGTSGLPLGQKFYPYCAEEGKDPRCEQSSVQKVNIWTPVDNLLAGALMVVTSEDGWVWIFRIILTTGMIGLGAPFWYKTYRFAGQFIPGRKSAIVDSTEERRQTSTGVVQNQPVLITVPNAEDISSISATDPIVQDSETEEVPSQTRSRSLRPAKKQVSDAETIAQSKTPVVTMQAVQPMQQSYQQTYQTQGKTGLQKGDLYNILKNTSVKNKE